MTDHRERYPIRFAPHVQPPALRSRTRSYADAGEAIPRSRALDVPLPFDDQAIAHAHQIDAAHRFGIGIAPAETPQDRRAVAGNDDVFEIEARAGRGRDAAPQFDARIATDVARAVRRR